MNFLSRLIALLLLPALLLSSTPVRALAAFASRENACDFSKRPAVAPLPNDEDTAEGAAETDIHAACCDLQTAGGGTFFSYLNNSKQLDRARGLYYLRARLMNPLTGRFWSADSYEGRNRDPHSLHKYLYCDADPLNGFDPSGRSTLVNVAVTAAIVAIAVPLLVYAINRFYTLNPKVNSDDVYAITWIPRLPYVQRGPLYYEMSRPARHVLDLHENEHVDGLNNSDESEQIIAQKMKAVIEDMLVNGSWGNRKLEDQEIVDLMIVWLVHDGHDDGKNIKMNASGHLETILMQRAPQEWGYYKEMLKTAEDLNYFKKAH